jgi:flavodoxin
VDPSELAAVDLLVVGSPTHGGRPTPAVQELLGKVTESSLEGVKIAAFDTRSTAKLARVFGYAAGRIARHLKKRTGFSSLLRRVSSLQAPKVR